MQQRESEKKGGGEKTARRERSAGAGSLGGSAGGEANGDARRRDGAATDTKARASATDHAAARDDPRDPLELEQKMATDRLNFTQ